MQLRPYFHRTRISGKKFQKIGLARFTRAKWQGRLGRHTHERSTTGARPVGTSGRRPTPSPALFPSIQPPKMGSSSFGFCGSCRRAAASAGIGKSGKLHRISGILFQKSGSWMREVCPSCLASRRRWSACSQGRISTAPNFWKKIAKNRARKAPHLAWACLSLACARLFLVMLVSNAKRTNRYRDTRPSAPL
jgi:hypothetical protein